MGFFRGLRYPFRGARIVFFRYPGMAVWWLPPILITMTLMGTGIWASFAYSAELQTALAWSEPAGEGITGWFLRGAHAAYDALLWLLPILLAGVAVVLSALLSSIVAAPFNDALSEAIECRETGKPAPAFSIARLVKDAVGALRIALGRLSLYLAVMVPCWLVSLLVPGVGQVIYSVVGLVFTTLYLALDYVDWPATRRGWDLNRRLSLAKKHPALLVGFGAAVWVFLFIPFVNLLFMPAAVAGGTRLFLDLEGESRESSDS